MLRMTRNGQFHPVHNFSNLFPPEWLRMTRNGQFCPIHNFSNLFPPKWLRMANFTWLATFPIFSNQSKPLFWQNLSSCVILSHFCVKRFKNLKNSKKLLMFFPQDWKILTFLQKWDALVTKVANWLKLTESFWATSVGKDWKSWNWAKSAISSHSELLRWEKIGKVVKRLILAIPSHSDPLWAEKDWKSCKSGKIGHSESFWASSVGKDWKSCKLDEIGHSKPLQWEKIAKVATKTKSNFPYIVGGRKGSSPSTSLADHQKLNVIQKWAFHFFGWREVEDGVRVHQPAWLIIRSWM